MKIAFVTSLNGGVGKFTFSLIDKLCLKKDIVQIDIYGFLDQRRIPIPELKEKVNIVKLFSHPLSLLFWLIRNLDKMGFYDLIHINHASFIWPFLILKFVHKNIKIVFSSRTAYIFEHVKAIEAFSFMFDMFSFPIASRLADAHTTFSHFNRRSLKQRFGANPIVIYNGIDRSKFHFSMKKRELTRKKLGIGDDNLLILYLGLLLPYKNVLDLIDVMPYVLKEIPSTKLLIVGRGPSLNEIINRVYQLGISDKVIIKTEFVKDTADFYSAADIFVFPAADGTHVLLEAMACGLPIIYAYSCSSPEIVGDAGLSFQIHNQKELCEKILTLARNESLKEKKRMEALARIRHFDWKEIAEKYYELYVNVLRKRR